MFSRVLAVACVLALLPAAATAQALPRETSVPRTPAAPAVPMDASYLTPPGNQPPTTQRRKDPLWNGVIIGAGLGALVGALIGSSVLECSECSGFNVPLTFGVLGAGAGAAIGAGIDAWHQTRPAVTIAPNSTRRLTVSPLLGKDVQGMVASIRF